MKATLGELDFKSNGIGLLRLLLAVLVVWCHSFSIGNFGIDPILTYSHWTFTTGGLAVGGFFALSGFLITRSRERTESGRFLWHRFLRIFPGYWACLIVTVLVFAPIAYAREFGTLAGYLTGPDAPWSYLFKNALLIVGQANIGNLMRLPIYTANEINGSLWTLQWEFLCYLLASIMFSSVPMLRRPAVAIVFAVSVLAVIAVLISINPLHTYDLVYILILFGFFGCGSVAYLLRNKIPMRGWVALVASIACVAFLATQWSRVFVVPCIAYVALYAAMTLPIRGFDRRVDLSYGVYVYSFPIQKLLAVVCALNVLGFTPFFVIALAASLAFALCSWLLVEKPASSLKNLGQDSVNASEVPHHLRSI